MTSSMVGDRSLKSSRHITHSTGANRRNWKIISFPSTLHLNPILEILLSSVPDEQRPDIHLGLQEALVNAAKHGNELDSRKSVFVRYYRSYRESCWVIVDQGSGFSPPQGSCSKLEDTLPCHSQSCGRGLFILNHVFDEVRWNQEGTALTLYKRHHPSHFLAFAGCSHSF